MRARTGAERGPAGVRLHPARLGAGSLLWLPLRRQEPRALSRAHLCRRLYGGTVVRTV